MKTRIVCTLVLLFSAGGRVAHGQMPAQAPTPVTVPTIDQSLEMKSASAPRISPDGRWVVYQGREAGQGEEVTRWRLWAATMRSIIRAIEMLRPSSYLNSELENLR